MLIKKTETVQLPMQELELNHPPTIKGTYIHRRGLVRVRPWLDYYGMKADGVCEHIKRDIPEFPVFRVD